MRDTIIKGHIIELCRKARKSKNITLFELSIKSGLSISSLSKFENGRFNWDYIPIYQQNAMNPAEATELTKLINSRM